MIPSMASISSPSSATVRVEKATSEFLIGPDWTLNIEICDTVNSNQMLAKDVVKVVKKRLQHKNPKVQLLALTLLETMVKNCGDYVHFQIAERNILQEMVKIVKKKTDMHVRDKILTLIESWHQAFGGPGGRYPQYYMAYEDLRRFGVQFPQRSPDPVPIFTPPATHLIQGQPQPGYGMPSGSSTRLDEAMAAEESLSLSSLNSMREVLDLLADMLKAVDPNDRMAIKDEVIIDLVDQCRANQRKLVQSLTTIADEELLGQGLELNDNLQSILAKHDAIASGSPLPPEVTNITQEVSEKHDSNVKSAEPSTLNTTASNDSPSPPALPTHKNTIDEEDEEEDDFAQLARRHSKTPIDNSVTKSDAAPSTSNAIVPVSVPTAERSKDQDIIDLLSITLSTPISNEQTSESPNSQAHTPPGQIPSTSSGVTFPSEGYTGMAFNSYVAPWAQPQPQPQPQPQMNLSYPQPQVAPEYSSYPQPQYQHMPSNQAQQEIQPRPVMHPSPHQPQYHSPRAQPHYPQYNNSATAYPPPPWAATPGYYTGQNSASRPLHTYPTARSVTSSSLIPAQEVSINGEVQASSSPRPTATNAGGQKPFIPSYRLFEDLDVFGNTDRRYNTSSASLLGSNHQNMVGGRK